jgi:hypothetical protein
VERIDRSLVGGKTVAKLMTTKKKQKSNLVYDLLGFQLFPDWTPENNLTSTSGRSPTVQNL